MGILGLIKRINEEADQYFAETRLIYFTSSLLLDTKTKYINIADLQTKAPNSQLYIEEMNALEASVTSQLKGLSLKELNFVGTVVEDDLESEKDKFSKLEKSPQANSKQKLQANHKSDEIVTDELVIKVCEGLKNQKIKSQITEKSLEQ